MNAKTKTFVTPYPKDKYYNEAFRQFQGIPTIGVTKKGRIFLGWESGGDHEPDPRQYCILHYSDDQGETWSEPVYAVDANILENIWIGDFQVWVGPDGKLYMFWVQHDYTSWEKSTDKGILSPNIWKNKCGFTWCAVCNDPDAETLVFDEPKYIFDGQMRNRPLVSKSGRIFYPAYDEVNENFAYNYSDDGGKTFIHKFGGKKVKTDGDEHMFYQQNDGTIVYTQRTQTGFVGVAYSKDNGETWTDAVNSNIQMCPSRFCIDKISNGDLCFVGNDHFDTRMNLTVELSKDEGKTWIKKLIDPRFETSYPEFIEFGDNIYITYDRERVGVKEILFCKITKAQIIDPDYIPEIKVVSKGDFPNPFLQVFYPDFGPYSAVRDYNCENAFIKIIKENK